MQLIGYEIADMYYCGETSCCHKNIFLENWEYTSVESI